MDNPTVEVDFGEKVNVTHKYKRVVERRNDNPHIASQRFKVWIAEECCIDDAVFLGIVTLSNGVTYWDSEYGWEYHPKNHFKSAVVCPGPGRKSLYVPLDRVKRA